MDGFWKRSSVRIPVKVYATVFGALWLAGMTRIRPEVPAPVKSMIIMIPDGCGIAHMTASRWYKGAPLVQDSMAVSLVRTYNANSLITGSASAGTAFACGHKTIEADGVAKCVGMTGDSVHVPQKRARTSGEAWRPVASVLEAARLAGKSTGLIATSTISHATPAAYSAHWHSRNDQAAIIKQQVFQGIDVVFGGGGDYLVKSTDTTPGGDAKGRRTDGHDLFGQLTHDGYALVSSKSDLQWGKNVPDRVWGMFAGDAMAHHVDRPVLAPEEPSLAEMVRAAIQVLSKNPKGFVLVVEGSQVDWSSHENDPVGVVTDYLAFDDAVAEALWFAESTKGKKTAVVVFPDHDNGGLSLGVRAVDYDRYEVNDLVKPIRQASMTAQGVARLLMSEVDRFHPDTATIGRIVRMRYGIEDLSIEELVTIAEEFADTFKVDYHGNRLKDTTGAYITGKRYMNIAELLGPMKSRRAGLSWTTYGHVGNDVPLFSRGLPEVPTTIDNTHIAAICERALGLSLAETTERLFADAQDLFAEGSVELDTVGAGAGKGGLRVRLKNRIVLFPFHTNLMIESGDTTRTEGVSVYSRESNRVFLPRSVRSAM